MVPEPQRREKLPVRALIIEHNLLDVELITKAMATEFALQSTAVQDLAEVGILLQDREWDVILSDHNLPGWSGMDALARVQKQGLDIPFILVTGTLGEEKAAEYFRHGVTDYVLKHRLELLPVAVGRALKEMALRREKHSAESRLRLLAVALEAADNAVVITDASGDVEWVNRAFQRLTGYASEEVKAKNPRFLKSGLHDRSFYEEMWKTITAGRVWEGEITNRRKDGTLYTELQTITPVRDKNGAIANYIGVKEDISDRKRAERALQVSEAAYRSVIEGAPYGIYRVREDGLILMANPALARMLGYDSAAELVGRNTASTFYTNQKERDAVAARWRGPGPISNYEVQWRKKDGKPILVRLAGSAWHNEGSEMASSEILVEDVTERRSLEAQLRQAQKMEAVGRLAGGVAHDFNNLLGVIVGYTDLVLESVSEERSRKRLVEVKKAAGRAVELTRQLLAFSRKQVLEPRIIDLNQVVTEVGKMLLRLLGEDIELVLSLSPILSPVKADPNQMEQVIINLAVNARDAMADGGRLTIETANVTLDENYGAQKHVKFTPGDYVMLAVTDTGTGMDEVTRARLFEPFFTTKELGKGTGLGLATVYGIVKQSGGYVWVYSELGRGTAFKVYLPKVGGTVAEPGAPPAKAIAFGHETVLLVEDSQSLNALNCEMLASLGYDVLPAGNGTEALRIAKEHKSAIHLLLTDVIMPGMNGRELAEQLVQMRPDLKVMYMSGYTDDMIVHHEILRPGVAFLQKPFSKEELANRIREVLRNVR